MLALVIAALVGAPPASRADLSCRGEGEGGYRVIDVESHGARFVVLGDRHSTDPADPFFPQLERLVADLSPTVILVEGQAGGPTPEDRTIAIQPVHG